MTTAVWIIWIVNLSIAAVGAGLHGCDLGRKWDMLSLGLMSFGIGGWAGSVMAVALVNLI